MIIILINNYKLELVLIVGIKYAEEIPEAKKLYQVGVRIQTTF